MESMSAPRSRAWVEVSLAAVVDNARTVARTAGTRLLPIVKANAYGLGAVPVSRALEAVDPWGYGVATVEEGAELRAAGIARPVLVLLAASPELFAEYRAARLTPVFDSAAALAAWLDGGGDAPFHLEIDTGMSRSGVPTQEFADLFGGKRIAERTTLRSASQEPPWTTRRLQSPVSHAVPSVGAPL